MQSNLVNTDTEGTIESVHIKRVMLFKLNKKHLLYYQNTEGIKENISIVKLNTSNPHKTVIPRTKSTETLKNHLVIKTVLCITHLIKIVGTTCYQMYCSAGSIDMLSTEGVFFFTRRRKGLLPHTVDSEMSALIREVDSLSESVDWARNKCPLSTLTGFRIKHWARNKCPLSTLTGFRIKRVKLGKI